MSNNPNKLSQFWQELKRRKVTRVITIYAAAAFVILELTDIVAPSLGLPDWTLNLIIILLCIGFIITVIVSWIYDVHPEGGIVKTEPAEKVKAEDMPESSNSWRIASYISFVVIVALIVLNIIPRANNNKEILDKSIAVLPFDNDSPISENEYYIKGYCTAVHSNLCKIEDLRILNLLSTEQYRNQSKSIPEIAKELGVGYVLSARGQIINNRIRLTVYLTNASDNIVWSNPYDREIEVVDDHINIQSEIAQLVAGVLQATITPEEQELIEKIPTRNNVAWEFYQKGMDEYWKSRTYKNFEAHKSAEDLFQYALEYDSTLAPAYVGLARLYYDLNIQGENYFSEDFLDTVLILANRALTFDPKLSDAYSIKGDYYRERGFWKEALLSYEKALELNPNDWSAYMGMGLLYTNNDLAKAIDNYSQAILRSHSPIVSRLFYGLGYNYYAAGFMNKGDSCNLEALKLTGDSLTYTGYLLNKYGFSGEYETAIQIIEKVKSIDFSDEDYSHIEEGYNHVLGLYYSYAGQFEKAVPYWDRYIEILVSSGRIDENHMHRIGYAYWMNGDMEKGTYYMNKQKEYCENAIKLGRMWAETYSANYDLAGVYAFQGEREKAYENLRTFNQRDKMPLWIASYFKNDPLFDSIRDEPEFQQIVREVEAKYQAEHERVRLWLEENDML